MILCTFVCMYVCMFESVNNSHAHIGIIVVFVFVYYKFTETRPTLNHRQSTKFLTNNKKKKYTQRAIAAAAIFGYTNAGVVLVKMHVRMCVFVWVHQHALHCICMFTKLRMHNVHCMYVRNTSDVRCREII